MTETRLTTSEQFGKLSGTIKIDDTITILKKNGKKVAKRYYADDLQKIEGTPYARMEADTVIRCTVSCCVRAPRRSSGRSTKGRNMIGAIAGDIIGSVYEQYPIKTKDFPLFHPQCRFTDDSVLTVAVAKAILEDGDYRKWVWDIGRRYPDAGYGGLFSHWLQSSDPRPYNSWGNGSAMRVSPVGFAFDTAAVVLQEAARSAAITHNHPEGVKGAQATALAVFLARTTCDKTLIRREVADRFGYEVNRTVEDIRPSYGFDVSCQGTVPAAIIAFLDSNSYEDAVRNAISLGGDSDTLACITGGIAEAYYGPVASPILDMVKNCLTEDLWRITEQFWEKYGTGKPNDGIELTR